MNSKMLDIGKWHFDFEKVFYLVIEKNFWNHSNKLDPDPTSFKTVHYGTLRAERFTLDLYG